MENKRAASTGVHGHKGAENTEHRPWEEGTARESAKASPEAEPVATSGLWILLNLLCSPPLHRLQQSHYFQLHHQQLLCRHLFYH